jgi:hypothetical protein
LNLKHTKKMKFIKIHIRHYKMSNKYAISIAPKEGYDIYFTDELGNLQAKSKEGVFIKFEELPSPLLKQIK